jgi:hypothetical protein
VDDKGKTLIPTFLQAVDAYWAARGQHVANTDDDLRALKWLTDPIGPDTLVTEIRNKTVHDIVAARAAMPLLSKPRCCKVTREMIPGQPQVVDFETGELRPFFEGYFEG